MTDPILSAADLVDRDEGPWAMPHAARAASPSDLSRLRRLRGVASTIAGDLILVTTLLSVIFVGAVA